MPTIPPIDPSMSVTGPEWSVGDVGSIGNAGSVDGTTTAAPSQGGFGSMLGDAIGKLDQSQTQAAQASQSLIDGTATDPSAVVMQVERAQLAMQLASQIRTKAPEAYTDIFHTQV
jgi:flagellar hook-basal body complex protein FliE